MNFDGVGCFCGWDVVVGVGGGAPVVGMLFLLYLVEVWMQRGVKP